ncbi:hypothetical protein WX45_00085 [Clostridium ljungdahlii DSM 13528]|uniref:Uncharacterized protein n=1 Tax=Clostridium ljungdahlii (strain ATCC 55383 / DSM 13528 / PETC) TaxID=748727 RepID=A0ABX2TS76_CLOLD|nr:hypothetical protein WX45_00085 [Clostridium ljungdahlii DSM 13528]
MYKVNELYENKFRLFLSCIPIVDRGAALLCLKYIK